VPHGALSLGQLAAGETVTIGFRVDVGLKAALEQAAADDHRAMTSLVEKLLTDHLRARGYLGAEAPAAGRSQGGKGRAAR
jgi:hypothetical protein